MLLKVIMKVCGRALGKEKISGENVVVDVGPEA